MIERKPYKWNVVLMNVVSGETKEIPAQSFWSPERMEEWTFNAATEMANATAAMYNTFVDRARTQDKQVLWAPVSAALVKS